MPFIEREGTKIYYTVDQAKQKKYAETIILIHTNIMDHTIYHTMIPLLSEKFQIVRYDLRGFGLSELGDETLTLDLYVEDLKFLITSLRLSSVHLAGFAFGGLIALKFGLLYEEMVEKLALMTMACFPEAHYKSVKAHRRKVSHNGTQIPVDTLIKKVTGLKQDDPEYARLHTMISNVPAATYNKIMDLTLYTNPIPFMEKTTKDTLILSAEREVVFPQNLLAVTSSYLENIQNTVVPNASSFLMIDQPEITARLLTEFLTEKQQRYKEDVMTNEIYENVRLYTENVYRAGKKSEQAVNEIHVDFLYSFRVKVNGEQIVNGWNQRYAKQMLLYLLFYQTATREQLCEQLWPDVPLKISKKNLRVYLYHLKRVLNISSLHESVLTFDREHIYMNGEISSDALSFIADVQLALNEKEETSKYELTLKVLNQLTAPGYLTVIFDDWFLELREKVEQDLIRLSVWLGKWLFKHEEWKIAKRELQRLAPIFDDHEEIDAVLLELDANVADNELYYG